MGRRITKKIGIIGCGNMGEAIISRLSLIAEKKLIASDIDGVKRDKIRTKYKVSITDNRRLVDSSDIIILAIKPKDFDVVLKDISGLLSKRKILISIAAGIRTKFIEDIVGRDIAVIRVMPNMSAIIGEAVSSISAGRSASSKDMRSAKEIFSAIGEVIEVNEDLVDGVTAVSGSGPAYFFYLVESLIEAARELGFDGEVARSLAIRTAIGSGKLLEVLKEEPSVLRARVTSKGGTTEAALKTFESKGFKGIVKAAVKKACERSKELSKG